MQEQAVAFRNPDSELDERVVGIAAFYHAKALQLTGTVLRVVLKGYRGSLHESRRVEQTST